MGLSLPDVPGTDGRRLREMGLHGIVRDMITRRNVFFPKCAAVTALSPRAALRQREEGGVAFARGGGVSRAAAAGDGDLPLIVIHRCTPGCGQRSIARDRLCISAVHEAGSVVFVPGTASCPRTTPSRRPTASRRRSSAPSRWRLSGGRSTTRRPAVRRHFARHASIVGRADSPCAAA